ncbi:hypothetical protein GDO81_011690 [Engystomops pustulosus]|uniref:Uncharacterized protein n=1 Tax=Engystomops pustulosus TaxID=76066 RepID=A0AAV7BG11_ENGPU|nr:hypothetical protein GDO81_011690 [Engystomops pustulosus]
MESGGDCPSGLVVNNAAVKPGGGRRVPGVRAPPGAGEILAIGSQFMGGSLWLPQIRSVWFPGCVVRAHVPGARSPARVRHCGADEVMEAPGNRFSRTTGSTVLQPISDFLHMPLEQVNFVTCQLLALVIAVWFRTYLNPRKAHTFIRHGIATIIGVYLAVFCFGWYSLHIFSLILLSYCVMIYASTEKVHR